MGFFGDLLGGISDFVTQPLNWAGDLVGIGMNHYENNRQMHFNHDEAMLSRQWQTDENLRNRNWQSEESAKSRDWQSLESAKARDWQALQWNTQFNLTNQEYDRRLQQERAYNDPVNQAKRLMSVGINPSVMGADNGGSTSFSAPDSPSLSAPAASPVTSPVASVTSAPSASVGSLGVPAPNFAQNVALLSQAGLSDASRNRIASLLEGDLYTQELMNGVKAIELEIAKDTKNDKVLDAYYTWLDKMQRAFLSEEMTASEKERQMTEVSKQLLNYSMASLTNEKKFALQIQIKHLEDYWRSLVRLQETESYENLANTGMLSKLGGYYSALSREVNWFNDVRGDASTDNEVFKSAKNRIIAEANKLIREGKLTNEQINFVREKTDLLAKENNIYYAKQISNEIKDYLSIGNDIARTATYQNFFNSESTRRNKRDEFDYEHYNDTFEEYEEINPTYNGKKRHKVSRKRKGY